MGAEVTVTDGLVFGLLAPLVESEAVTVRAPVVRSVTEKVFVPATSAAFAGRLAWPSDEVIATVSVEADRVPVGVDRVDGDAERGAGGLRARRAGLAARGARGCGLARQQDLQLRERAGVDRDVDGLVFGVFVPSVWSRSP